MQRLLERGLPAAILILVALLQLYLTQTANLSPWKGGGFGMFGTTDAPDMRVIQAEGLDQQGNLIQFDLYSALDARTIRRTRTLPRQSDLEQMAPQLINQPIVPTTVQRQAVYQKFQESGTDLPTDRQTMLNPSVARVHLPPTLSGHPITQPLYRLKTVFDPELPEAVKTLKAIRLQWWRIRFDPTNHRLWSEPLSSVVEAGVWP
jgi:hypothetical protein